MSIKKMNTRFSGLSTIVDKTERSKQFALLVYNNFDSDLKIAYSENSKYLGEVIAEHDIDTSIFRTEWATIIMNKHRA